MNSEYENMKKWKDKTLAKQNQKIIDDADFYWKDQASKLMVRVLRMISFLRKIMSLDMLRGNSRLRDEALEILDKYDPSEEELNQLKSTDYQKVIVVGFELRSNPSDDNGIEIICDDINFAEKQIEILNQKYPAYKFFVWGDYVVLKHDQRVWKFNDDGTTAIVGYLDYDITLGDIIPAMHFDGVIYDCEVSEISDNQISLKKLKVDDIFYQRVISQKEKYEAKNSNYDSETLEWAASWIENSLIGEENARVIEFGKNMAMSIRANKEI